MHRPDGIPDAVEQVKHGISAGAGADQGRRSSNSRASRSPISASTRTWATAHRRPMAASTRRSSARTKWTGNYSGNPGRPVGFHHEIGGHCNTAPRHRWRRRRRMLKGWDDALAKECLDTAVKIWEEEHAHPTASQSQSSGRPPGMAVRRGVERCAAIADRHRWRRAIQEARSRRCSPRSGSAFGFGGWSAVRALPYMDAEFRKQLEEAVKSYVAQLDKDLAATPFGVPPSRGRLGRIGRGRRSRRADVLPAQGVSRDRGQGLHASRGELHPGHASGIEHVVCVGVSAPSRS